MMMYPKLNSFADNNFYFRHANIVHENENAILFFKNNSNYLYLAYL